MSIAKERLMVYTRELQEILLSAARKREKGQFFYANKGRDILFRLEALTRLYRTIQDKKFFDGWYKEFKALEDTLGALDHGDAMFREFSSYKPLKKSAEKILLSRFNEEMGFLNDTLVNNGWLSGEKLREFESGLESLSWKENEEDLLSFAEGLLTELQKLEEKYRGGELDLYVLEEGLHEFRRRLRWISIYSSAANGAVQLRMVKTMGPEFGKYCIKSVTESPFNMMPRVPKGIRPIEFQSHYFYAMSWLINLLGELKDVGMRYETFKELNAQLPSADRKLKEQFFAACKHHPDQISALAEMAVDTFIYEDHILERLQRDLLRYLHKS
jgi:hypothetical protein